MARDEKEQELARCTLVVTCVVIRVGPDTLEDEVLILKRAEHENEGPNLWTIPGGKVRVADLGEPLEVSDISHKMWLGVLERAIFREVKEEAGINANFVFLMPEREKIFTRKDGTPALVLAYWTVCPLEAKVTIGSESTEYRWVKEAELAQYEFIGNVRDDIRAALRRWRQ